MRIDDVLIEKIKNVTQRPFFKKDLDAVYNFVVNILYAQNNHNQLTEHELKCLHEVLDSYYKIFNGLEKPQNFLCISKKNPKKYYDWLTQNQWYKIVERNCTN